jgi:tRNA nucleotidyltransferase (CCA-adding enzyme)
MSTTHLFHNSLSRFDQALLQRLGIAAYSEGALLYLVGGSVRDWLLGRPVMDLDLASETEAEAMAEVLIQGVGGTGKIISRSQFGTVKLEIEGREIDLATARSERYARPGSLPTVAQGTIHEDLSRRDFSVNALALALWASAWGQVLDPEDGIRDIERRVVRALHRGSFEDDATRILRAVRYAVRLGFGIDRLTLRWLRLDARYLQTISGHRIRRELERVLSESNSTGVLIRLHRLGALHAIHPALGTPQVAQALRTARSRGLDPLAALGALTYALDRQEAEQVVKRLAFTDRQQRFVRNVQSLKEAVRELSKPSLQPHQVVRLAEGHDVLAVASVAALAPLALTRSRLRHYLTSWSGIRPALRGHDLMALGVPEGSSIGRLLAELRDARVDGRIKSRRSEIAHVRVHMTEVQQ